MHFNHSVIQSDCSIRYVDADGDLMIPDEECPATPSTITDEHPTFDGASAPKFSHRIDVPAGRDQRYAARWIGDRMSGTVSIDLVEEISGIARVNVELR